jgi:hypothetical protein
MQPGVAREGTVELQTQPFETHWSLYVPPAAADPTIPPPGFACPPAD